MKRIGPTPGCGDDVNLFDLGRVILGGESVAHDVDGFDLRLRRQRGAEKLSTRMTALPPARSWSCWAISVGSSDSVSISVGTQRRCERVAARIGRGEPRVLLDVHRFGHALDGEDHDMLVVAGSETNVFQHAGLETRKLRLNRVASGGSDSSVATPFSEVFAAARPAVRVLSSTPPTTTVAAGITPAARIDHRDYEARLAWGLRGHGQGQRQEEQRAHHQSLGAAE